MIKILLIDIETAPNEGYFWGLFGQNIPINHIVEPGYTMCWTARWLHEDEAIFRSIHTHTDGEVFGDVWELMDEADVIVHYNGKKFDVPVLNREFLKRRISPPSPYHQIDLYHVVRRNFRFASNKLDFVCQELGIGGKIQHKGMELWKDCMQTKNYDFGDVVPRKVFEAWDIMEEYNRQDVELLDTLYRYLLPWISNHPNVALWMKEGKKPKCVNCGSEKLRFKGYKRTKTMAYKQYRCKSCGTYSRERFADDSFKKRKDVLT